MLDFIKNHGKTYYIMTYKNIDLSTPEKLPSLWLEWFDNHLVQLVKQNYFPKKNIAQKPFCLKDAQFFSKSICELSEKFNQQTQYRSYADHPRYRSGYLLYFLSLHLFD